LKDEAIGFILQAKSKQYFWRKKFMAFWNCSDPFVEALKSAGYNMILLPKSDIQPLQLFYKNGKSLERLGAAKKLLMAGEDIKLPRKSKNTQAANINGKRTSSMDIGIGLSLLGTIIGAMGGSTLGLDAEYKNAKTAAFEFSDVKEDKIEVIDLDQYLGDADINPASVYVGKLLEADKLYITTAVIKSNKFTFEAQDSNGVAVGVNVPTVQGLVTANVKVGTESTSETKLSYEGEEPLVFGFQAIKLYYENGKYTRFDPANKVTMKSIDGDHLTKKQSDDKFIGVDNFVEINDLS
jgi:hypothetical protein